MADDVRTRLSEALDEAEKRARALLAEAQRASLAVKEPRLLGREIPGWHQWPDVEAMCARELRLIQRDRQLLADFDAVRDVDLAWTKFEFLHEQVERAAAVWLGTQEASDGS